MATVEELQSQIVILNEQVDNLTNVVNTLTSTINRYTFNLTTDEITSDISQLNTLLQDIQGEQVYSVEVNIDDDYTTLLNRLETIDNQINSNTTIDPLLIEKVNALLHKIDNNFKFRVGSNTNNTINALEYKLGRESNPEMMYMPYVLGMYDANIFRSSEGFLNGVVSEKDANFMALSENGHEDCVSLFLATRDRPLEEGQQEVLNNPNNPLPGYEGIMHCEWVKIGTGNTGDALWYKQKYAKYGLESHDMLLRFGYPNNNEGIFIFKQNGNILCNNIILVNEDGTKINLKEQLI